MNGAESLLRTLVGSGVEVCFGNPGTSEMHFVAALDRVEGMRVVLGLFEGAVTGMADGYGRMAEKPAATLLHLGWPTGSPIFTTHAAPGRRSSISSATTRPIMRNTTPRSRRTYMVSRGQSLRGCIRRSVPGLSPRTERWPCKQHCNIPVRSLR
jgi:glyoxylate carboligase